MTKFTEGYFSSKFYLAMAKIKIAFIIILSFVIGRIEAQDLSEKATIFLNTLTPELTARTVFALSDSERFNMNYIPIQRRGPTFHDFNDKQKAAALELLKASLSKEGYHKTTEIMELEKVLIIIENNQQKMADGSPMRDPLNYHFCIFGKPSATGFWGWRFEGHHVSLNFTSTEGKIISSTPSFLGSNPGIVTIKEDRGKEVLKQETDLGFMLVNSLTEDQLKIARFADVAPGDIITGNKRKVEEMELRGISYSKLTDDQKKIFMKLLNVYIDNYTERFSKTFRDKINKAGIDNLYFGWAGSLKPGIGQYYRIQGPVLLIEYDNTQNNANHVHTVVRDLTSDYGEDLLREHYDHDHHN